MEKSILMAWAAGLGLLTWQQLQRNPWRPPPPGRYLAASGLYAALALVAANQKAAPVAALVAWGFDLAVAFTVLPQTAATAAGGAGKAAAQAVDTEGTQTA